MKCSGSTKHSMLASLRGRLGLCCAEWMLDTAQLLLPQGRRNSLSPVALQLSQQLTGDDHGFVDGAEGEDLVLGILRDFVQEVSVGVALQVCSRRRRGHGRVTTRSSRQRSRQLSRQHSRQWAAQLGHFRSCSGEAVVGKHRAGGAGGPHLNNPLGGRLNEGVGQVLRHQGVGCEAVRVEVAATAGHSDDT